MKILGRNEFIFAGILFIILLISLGIYKRNSIDKTSSEIKVLSANDILLYESNDNIATFPAILDYIVISETPIPTPTRKPTLSPTPTRVVYKSSDFDEWFTKYSQKESIDRNLLRRIAVCESGLNPRAVNGIYGGLFQFSTGTWISNRRAMNMDTNPELRFHPEEAIRTAAFRIATVGIHAWPNCHK